MPSKTEKATTGLEAGASVGGAVAGIGIAAGAANAVPIVGQVASAALGLAALFTAIFTKRKQRKRREAESKQKAVLQQQAAYRQAMNSFQPQGEQMMQPFNYPTQGMQGYGLFQQMQEENTPIYTSGQGTNQ